jgi:hypothetical protein
MLNSCYFTHKINMLLLIAQEKLKEKFEAPGRSGHRRSVEASWKKYGKSRPEELLFGDTKIYIDSIS